MPLWQQRRIHAQSIWLRGRQFKIPMPNMIEHTPPTPLNTNTKQKKNPHTPLRSFVRSISRTAAHTNTFVPLYIQSAIKLASITLIIQANGTWFWYAICSIWIFDPPASTRRRSVGYTPPRRCVSRRLDGLALLSAANTGWLAGGHHYLSLSRPAHGPTAHIRGLPAGPPKSNITVGYKMHHHHTHTHTKHRYNKHIPSAPLRRAAGQTCDEILY